MFFKRFIPIIYLCLLSCAHSLPPSDAINSIDIQSIINTKPTYTIHEKNTQIGTTTLTMDPSFLIQKRSTIKLTNSITNNSIGRTVKIPTYIVGEMENGYHLYDDTTNTLIESFLPSPLIIGSIMTGKFGIFTDDIMSVYATAFHSEFTNLNGLTFHNVMELQSPNNTIVIFVNKDYFLIQIEDYRTTPLIQSLSE